MPEPESYSAEALNNAAVELLGKGQFHAAMAALQQALDVDPNFAPAYTNLGICLRRIGRSDAAIAAYRHSLSLDPSSAQTLFNLGCLLQGQRDLDAAAQVYRQCLALDENFVGAFTNLGNVLRDQGLLDEALACYRRAVELAPNDAQTHSNLIYLLHFHPGFTAEAIFAEATHYDVTHAASRFAFQALPDRPRDPNRRLRIGYVSRLFRTHPMADNFLPLLTRRDRKAFEVFCYGSISHPDGITARLRGLTDHWRDIAQLSDDQSADIIRADAIDILVDLGAHMSNNRLPIFARKPAPIQMTALASMGTTGVRAIDYRISDRHSDPPDFNDRWYAEETIRLPDCYFAHEPPAEALPVQPAPVLSRGWSTFGCLNNFCKVTPQVLELWSRILRSVSGSHLVLRCPAGSAQQRVRAAMVAAGVDGSRIAFVDRVLPREAYLALHHEIDILLDPFPYSGHTTSVDALWMGVPIVTLEGNTDVGRSGVFLLDGVGMRELIARDTDEYAHLAIALASDIQRLAHYRSELRQRLLASPVLNPVRFAHDVEAAYRTVWQRWCAATPESQGRSA
jgi:predicted O-linked N-acetylglucosamine transferase (SPINDLY family)